MGKEILVNQVFAGSYLEEGSNIGHEIVNFFKADDRNNYVYVTPSGKVNRRDIPEAIVFVRNIRAKKTVEVIGFAKGLKPVTLEESEAVKYAGVSAKQIFGSNAYRGSNDRFYGFTYQADELLVPSSGHQIILTVDDKCNGFDSIQLPTKTMKVMFGQRARGYFPIDKDEMAYKTLLELVSDDGDRSGWKPVEALDVKRLNSMKDIATSQRKSFLEVINKEDDELVFSNLLAYYLDFNHEVFQRFASELLGIDDMDDQFKIVRESNWNIDLWIEDKNHVIVVENKIKSGLNGSKSDGSTQLDKYYEEASKYAEENKKETKFFLFAPNYSPIDLTKLIAKKDKRQMSDIYSVIHYSDLYDFFSAEKDSYKFEDGRKVYYDDFLKAMKKHSLTSAEYNFEVMQTRFLKKILDAE